MKMTNYNLSLTKPLKNIYDIRRKETNTMIKHTHKTTSSSEEMLVLLAMALKFGRCFLENGLASPDEIRSYIKEIFQQQYNLFILKYNHSPETRREIEKEMNRITVNEAIQDLHKILGINQVDESNFMQFGNKTLKEMLNETLDINTDATDATEQNMP